MIPQPEKGVKSGSEIFSYVSSSISDRLFFSIEYIGHFFCSQQYCVSRNQYCHYLMICVVSGTGVAKVSEQEYIMQPGDVLLVETQKPHIYAALEDMEFYFMHITGPLLNMYYEYITSIHESHVHTLTDKAPIVSKFEAIYNSFAAGQQIVEPILSARIDEILALLSSSAAQAQTPIEKAIQHISEHYMQNLNLETLSKLSCMSLYHFSRCFKKATGYTPHRFIIKTRLNVARYLLGSTDLSVNDIALQVGFNDTSAFIAAFKEKYLRTPSQFRKSNIYNTQDIFADRFF